MSALAIRWRVLLALLVGVAIVVGGIALVRWSSTPVTPRSHRTFGIAENETQRAEAAEQAIREETVKGSRLEEESVSEKKYGKESIPTKAYGKESITSATVLKETLLGNRIAKESITSGQFASESITPSKLMKEAVGKEALAKEAVSTAEKVKAHALTLETLATAVSKQIPAEHGRSAEMTAGEITITAPAVTTSGAIVVSTEGTTAIGASVVERKVGEGFKVKATGTSTDRIDWTVWTE